MAVRPWHLLTLCDGYGGTELALRSVVRVRTVARVERDAYAAAVLVARMEEQRLDLAPVWDDLCTFDGRPWRGRVDIVAAGFPCQPFSAAGKRLGVDDDRWLWPSIARIIGAVRPSVVLLENVPQLVRHGLPHVLADLTQLGFDAEWGMLSASAVGAPHKRQRFWLVGHASRPGRSEVTLGTPRDETANGRESHSGHLPHCAGEDVADAPCQRCHRGHGVDRDASAPEAEVCRERLSTRWPPDLTDIDGWADYIAFGGPQPTVRRRTDGPPAGLADALHLGGNGLVPQCAAEAWRQLIERAGW